MGEDISLQIPEEPVLILRGIAVSFWTFCQYWGPILMQWLLVPWIWSLYFPSAQGLDALYIITTALSGSFSILAWVTCLALAIHVSKTGDDVGIWGFTNWQIWGLCFVLYCSNGLGPFGDKCLDNLLFDGRVCRAGRSILGKMSRWWIVHWHWLYTKIYLLPFAIWVRLWFVLY